MDRWVNAWDRAEKVFDLNFRPGRRTGGLSLLVAGTDRAGRLGCAKVGGLYRALCDQRLSGLVVRKLIAGSGPEHIALGPDGLLYTGVSDGLVLRMQADGTGQEVFAETGGRVLGFEFDAAGNLIAADACKGLLSIDSGGKVTLLTDRADDQRIGFADAVVVATDGRIYFTDASTRFHPTDGKAGGSLTRNSTMDIIEQSCTGRILEYDPTSGSTRVVARGLSFANGLVMSDDETKLLVAETGRYRIWKIDITADDLNVSVSSPLAVVLLEHLPGFPDNLLRGRDGKIWAGLFQPRIDQLDEMSNRPSLRKLALRLPEFLRPGEAHYGHVFAFDEDGAVLANLQDPSGSFPLTTGATETSERLYITTLKDRGLAWLSL